MPTDPVGQSPGVDLEGAGSTDKSTAALPLYSAFIIQFLDFYTIRCGILMDPWGGTGTAQNVRGWQLGLFNQERFDIFTNGRAVPVMKSALQGTIKHTHV